MHKVDADGATGGNEYTDGNPQTNTPATVVGAKHLNTIQRELVAIVEAADINLDDEEDEQILEALRKIINQQSYFLKIGKLDWFDDYHAPAADFPYLCLTNEDAVLTTTNWPDLVPYLRAKKVRYKPNLTGAKTAFDVTNFARATNVVTLTLANTAGEIALVKALAEDNLVHGSYTNWRTITLPNLISDVPVGDYRITAVDATARTISFEHTGSDGSSGVTSTVEHYPHRIAGQTTQARHLQVGGRALVSVNDADFEIIGGLRRRDRAQGHKHTLAVGGGGGLTQISIPTATGTLVSTDAFGDLVTDGTNGTPRTGKTTDPRALGAFLYMWAQTYVP